ncbi:MAG: PRC-barrel domain protein [candidate division WS2 bacterium ADurb.Bin280]|uniref:PRC-barrel domain protein n=1 Tax=candidate division WS2 bacterium ADurb.Bin280 TaxID=1852829 RepID=A0A1V5SB69_9BACT|nr:MAG: PRC-barrel domain protein [candidate division WS2 bacterium ADurb.Bin280]
MTVGSLAEGEAVGLVQKTIVDPKGKRLEALVVKKGGYFSKSLVVSIADIIEIEKNGVVINREDSLVEKEEIHKIAQIIDSRFEIFNLPAVTKDGKRLGRIQDVLIDGRSGEILRLYVKGLVSKRVIDRSQIIKITLKEAVVAPDEALIKQSDQEDRPVVLDANIA